MSIKYCKKRKENFEVGKTPEDYCVDCSFYDNDDCWACDLQVKYIEDEPVYLVKETAKIIPFKKEK